MILSLIFLPLAFTATNPEYLMNATIYDMKEIVHDAMISQIATWPKRQKNVLTNEIPAIEESFVNQSKIILSYRSKQYVETLDGTLDQSEIMVAITLEDIANRYLQIIASADNIPDSPFMSSGFLTKFKISDLGSEILGTSKFQKEDLRVKVGLPTYDILLEKGNLPLKWYYTRLSRYDSSFGPLFDE